MKTRYDFAVQADRLQALQAYGTVVRTLRQSKVQSAETESAEELRNKVAVNTSFKVYPNPANDVLYIKYQLASVGYVVLYDLYGKEIRKEVLDADQTVFNIPVSDIQTGLYLLRIYSEEGGSFVHKVLISR